MPSLLLPCFLIAAAQASAEAPADRPIVGAIRWDAWHGPESEVGLTVEKTLAPAHWHYRLPFYGKEIDENTVEARGHTQAIMDQEIAYAHAASLDYWAFVIYPEEHALSLGLKLYLSSERRHLVRFCLDLQGGWEGRGGMTEWPQRIQRYLRHFQGPTYQTVLNGRPLVYIYSGADLVGPGKFATWDEARTAFDQLRADTVAAGLKTPYIVAQGWSPEAMKDFAGKMGFDAVGAYASSAGEKAAPYSALAAHTEKWWDTFKATGLPVAPLVSAGWDMRPRIETPTPWVQGGDIEQYYEAPKPEELGAHLRMAIEWCRANPEAAEAQAILIYAWNEFDEGGWICPTLSEGTARLDAIGEAVKSASAGPSADGG